ncbi:unnamed protein product [Kluyveromyces dobzhanskii CBS 2104]|uniref:WGS project CCBQ000000000 data, contig 00016 n=1 Tax=Kluyveromyces dobzhanskii CBS 2104 TaxID=1427455 RepID=A0A0A8KZX3_9SACH|nr:unnamed protein product [Kluyveromyces dobzhanskii CBS 2104]
MFTARRISSTVLEDVQCLNRLSIWKKTVVIRKNGDFDIYTNEGLHTYRKLWNEPILDTGYSEALSTLFVQCEQSLVLFNVGNMEQYDKIVDRRGIQKFWCLEYRCNNEISQKTVVVVLLKTKIPRLKMFTWISSKFSKLVEIQLSSKREIIISIAFVEKGVVIVTNIAVYVWKVGGSVLTRVDKVVSPKWPASLSSSLRTLGYSVDPVSRRDNSSTTESLVWSSFANVWPSDKKTAKVSKDLRYLFAPDHKTCILLDGHTQKFLQLHGSHEEAFYLKALTCDQFFRSNLNFKSCHYLGFGFMVLYNNSTLRVVDYAHGFVYLTIKVADGIKRVFQQSPVEIMVWTLKDVIETYKIDVDEDLNMKTDSLGGSMFDLNFETLEKRVAFYKNILKTTYLEAMNIAEEGNETRISYIMKLRDLYIVYALQVFDKAQKLHSTAKRNGSDHYSQGLYERIMHQVFQIILQFLAPPVLIISYCFPENSEIIRNKFSIKNQYFREAPAELSTAVVKKNFLPYLTEVRRHMKNISKGTDTYWSYHDTSLKLTLSFFESHNQAELSASDLLTIIDTTLFEMYVKYNRPMVGPLVRVDNSCDFDTVEALLRKENMVHELIDFYFYNHEHQKALDLLTEILDRAGDLKPGIKTIVIEYLKNLELIDLDLVLHYSDYLLENFPDETFDIIMLIFLQPLPFSKELDHRRIYEYIDSKHSDLSLSYLEFIVGELQSSESLIFCTLLKRYLQNISDPNTVRKLHAVLKSSKNYDPKRVLKVLKDAIDGYKNTNAPELRALKYLIVYPINLLGEHQTALTTLWEELHDYQQTSEYCNMVYNNDSIAGSELLNDFLDRIIVFDNEHKKPHYLQLFLADHGSKLDSDEVLLKLPENMSVADISSFFNTELKNTTAKQNELALLKDILYSDLIKSNFKLANVLSEFFVISEERKCPICNKLLKNTSADSLAIITYKKKTYVMYLNCAKKLQAKIKHDEEQLNGKRTPLLSELL